MNETVIRKRIEDYLVKRKMYFDECNEIRANEREGQIYPWNADDEIKKLDDDYIISDEKLKYDELREKTKNDSDFNEVFERVFKNILEG